MIADKLKKSALQAAIQGKLSRQLPTDGDAKELLKKIRAEKSKLIAEGNLKAEKNLLPITDDEKPFDIPQNWAWCRLGDISLKIQYGFTASANTVGNAKLLRITDIQNDKVCWQKVPYCNIPELRKNEYLLHDNDLVIARTGGTVGKTFVIEHLTGDTIFASYLIRAVFGQNISAKFIKIFSGSPLYWRQITDKVKGTGQPNVNGQSLSNLILPLPPLAEQKRIVERVEKLLSEIELLSESERELEELEKNFPRRMKNSLLQAAIQGKLTEQLSSDGDAKDLLKQIRVEKNKLIAKGKIKAEKELPPITAEEIPFDLPDNWVWARFGDIFQHNTGKTQNSSIKTNKGKLRKFITTSNLYWNRFDFSKVKEMLFSDSELSRYTATKGDLLICEGGDYGRSAIWNYDYDVCFQNHIHRARPITKNSLCVKFYYYVLYFLKSINFIEGRGIGIKGLSANYLHKILVPLPPLAEQKRIVERLEELLPLCDI